MKQSSLRQFIGDIMTVAAFVIAIVASAGLTLGTEAHGRNFNA